MSHGAELLDVKQTAKLLNTSARTVYRLTVAGKMPRPLKLGALVRWRAGELRFWIDGGCRPCPASQPMPTEQPTGTKGGPRDA